MWLSLQRLRDWGVHFIHVGQTHSCSVSNSCVTRIPGGPYKANSEGARRFRGARGGACQRQSLCRSIAGLALRGTCSLPLHSDAVEAAARPEAGILGGGPAAAVAEQRPAGGCGGRVPRRQGQLPPGAPLANHCAALRCTALLCLQPGSRAPHVPHTLMPCRILLAPHCAAVCLACRTHTLPRHLLTAPRVHALSLHPVEPCGVPPPRFPSPLRRSLPHVRAGAGGGPDGGQHAGLGQRLPARGEGPPAAGARARR